MRPHGKADPVAQAARLFASPSYPDSPLVHDVLARTVVHDVLAFDT